MNSQPLRLASGFLQVLPNLLHKDEGPLPYYLARDHGYQSTLVYWMKRAEPLILPEGYDSYVKRVLVSTSESRLRRRYGFWHYIVANARKTDVLLMYHLTSESLSNAILYKTLNPSGVCVLKMDMDHRGLVAFERSDAMSKREMLMRLFRRAPFDFVTIESESIYERLVGPMTDMGHPLELLPVGIDTSLQVNVPAAMDRKRKVILAAGRLGVVQKNTEMLLLALERLEPRLLERFEICLVGSRTSELEAFIDRLRVRRPDLSQRLVLHDFVNSRDELARLYRSAEIFCLTSRWESFGIVLAEAALAGCYIISTDVGIAREVTGNGRHGELVRDDDPDSLARALTRALSGSVDTRANGLRAHELAMSRYGWPSVASRFDSLVRRYRSAKR